MRITNPKITELAEDEIFVFGSNLSGRHGKGAAKLAMQKFGAKYGVAKGFTGKCYALPTVNASISEPVPIDDLLEDVIKLCQVCYAHTNLKFLITEVGCGLAGLTVKQVAPLFKPFMDLENVWLPERFINYNSKADENKI